MQRSFGWQKANQYLDLVIMVILHFKSRTMFRFTLRLYSHLYRCSCGQVSRTKNAVKPLKLHPHYLQRVVLNEESRTTWLQSQSILFEPFPPTTAWSLQNKHLFISCAVLDIHVLIHQKKPVFCSHPFHSLESSVIR